MPNNQLKNTISSVPMDRHLDLTPVQMDRRLDCIHKGCFSYFTAITGKVILKTPVRKDTIFKDSLGGYAVVIETTRRKNLERQSNER